MDASHADTIAAIATPAGKGAIGIIRTSGPLCGKIMQQLLQKEIAPRQVHVGNFYDSKGEILDYGVAIFFTQPNSYTGEDMFELHAHGNPVILNRLLQTIYSCGARGAESGEFSQRAFLGGKLDLTQAEAIADLINADNELAALACTRSMQGNFATHIHQLDAALIELRVVAEAAIDFPDEMSETPNRKEYEKFERLLEQVLIQIKDTQQSANRGYKIQSTAQIALSGPPNSGKSTLLNAMSGRDSAIVSQMPGTTRDVIREAIQIDGMSFTLSDTAGLRAESDMSPIEKEGIQRAKEQARQADHILWVYDCDEHKKPPPIPFSHSPCTIIANKCDLSGQKPAIKKDKQGVVCIYLSALDGWGVDLLTQHLKALFHNEVDDTHGQPVADLFSARQRHLDLLNLCQQHLAKVKTLWEQQSGVEFVAEELRLAQNNLGEITGALGNEELLGEIFNQFCIGK